jgi:hypothetical protein
MRSKWAEGIGPNRNPSGKWIKTKGRAEMALPFVVQSYPLRNVIFYDGPNRNSNDFRKYYTNYFLAASNAYAAFSSNKIISSDIFLDNSDFVE